MGIFVNRLGRWFRLLVGMVAWLVGVEAATGQVRTQYVPNSAVAAVVVYPHRVLTAPDNALYPIEVLSAAGIDGFGIDPIQIEEMIVLVAQEPGTFLAQLPPWGAIIRFRTPTDVSKLLGQLVGESTTESTPAGEYTRAAVPSGISAFRPDGKTLLLGAGSMLDSMVAAPAEAGPIAELLSKMTDGADIAVVVNVEPLRQNIRPLFGMPRLASPRVFAGIEQLPDLLANVQLSLQLCDTMVLTARYEATDDQSAERIEQILTHLVAAAQETALSNFVPGSSDPVERALASYMKRLTDHFYGFLEPKRDGRTVVQRIETDSIDAVPVFGGMMLGSVRSARVRATQLRTMANMRDIAHAMINYDVLRREFPQDIVSRDGKPLLSWRVKILPYIEQRALYDQFRLDEPWDSEHNIKLLKMVPSAFRHPAFPPVDGKTVYLKPIGPGTVGNLAKGEGSKTIEQGDGTDQTILLVEADSSVAVPWTKPDDWHFDPNDPRRGLYRGRNDFIAVFTNGRVEAIEVDRPAEAIRSLVTTNAGD